MTGSDADLVAATLAGDQAAFATLVGRYERAVRAVSFHALGDHHAGEDAAQEAFIAAYRRLAGLRKPELFGHWLMKIARRRAQGIRCRHRQHLPLEHAAEVAGKAPATQPACDGDRMLSAVMRLPERQRQLLLLRHFDGHGVADIAAMTGRSVGTITKDLSRGYARLRERLTEVGL